MHHCHSSRHDGMRRDFRSAAECNRASSPPLPALRGLLETTDHQRRLVAERAAKDNQRRLARGRCPANEHHAALYVADGQSYQVCEYLWHQGRDLF